VYRLDPESGRATVATADVNRPNGLAFSPDEKKLYIIEAGVIPRVIKVYDVNEDKLANGRAFITAEPGGTPDGFRCDVEGNLWCGWGMGNAQQDGVKIYDPFRKSAPLSASNFGELPPSRMRHCTSLALIFSGSKATLLTTKPSVSISPRTRPSSASTLRLAAFRRRRSLRSKK
jgi:hypothetical protein